MRTVDLTSFFCGRSRCFPVVAGALVSLDQDHVAPRFGGTLAPCGGASTG